ncbi:hypothetical protein PFUGPA_03782 [Plasmodium falciparum Palo Alto/Uganda]|uniref:Uncharacterized protein n=2 Tax=Plasmodium falciparum TaxID=5833 RepID=A0A024W034_PLAFA|nr:hypothetical protein PFTANZ_05227 [Plasmodium falciparum Tanzania (2000708)]ETW53909.1 hypothetical protein PFUGPA_03782 [Plasmodium falciparum Palo Alto/Uganda]
MIKLNNEANIFIVLLLKSYMFILYDLIHIKNNYQKKFYFMKMKACTFNKKSNSILQKTSMKQTYICFNIQFL